MFARWRDASLEELCHPPSEAEFVRASPRTSSDATPFADRDDVVRSRRRGHCDDDGAREAPLDDGLAWLPPLARLLRETRDDARERLAAEGDRLGEGRPVAAVRIVKSWSEADGVNLGHPFVVVEGTGRRRGRRAGDARRGRPRRRRCPGRGAPVAHRRRLLAGDAFDLLRVARVRRRAAGEVDRFSDAVEQRQASARRRPPAPASLRRLWRRRSGGAPGGIDAGWPAAAAWRRRRRRGSGFARHDRDRRAAASGGGAGPGLFLHAAGGVPPAVGTELAATERRASHRARGRPSMTAATFGSAASSSGRMPPDALAAGGGAIARGGFGIAVPLPSGS